MNGYDAAVKISESLFFFGAVLGFLFFFYKATKF